MQQLKPAKLAILLCLILLLGAVVPAPVHALTTCQTTQSLVDSYLNNPPNIYCKFTSEKQADRILIYKDCDYRPQAVKTRIVSLGGTHHAETYNTLCYTSSDPNGYLKDTGRIYNEYISLI